MNVSENVGGRDRALRAVLAVGLAVVALSAFESDRRLLGGLAGVAALGFGFNAVTCFCGLYRALGIETTEE